jgi:citrate synthase
MFTEAFSARNDESIEELAAKLVDSKLEAGEPMPGYHHPMHTNGDPRVDELVELAQEEDVAGNATNLALEIENILHDRTGKELLLNVDGAAAALTLDLGFSPTFSRAIFLLSRTAGLIAHFIEEETREDVWRTVSGDVEYDGPAKRELPR